MEDPKSYCMLRVYDHESLQLERMQTVTSQNFTRKNEY